MQYLSIRNTAVSIWLDFFFSRLLIFSVYILVNLRQTLAKQLKAGFMLIDITKGFQRALFKLVLRDNKKQAWSKLLKTYVW